VRRQTVLLVTAASAASLVATALGGQPNGGILEPAGAGVRIVYALGNSSVQCSFGRSGHVPRLVCGIGGRSSRQIFRAIIDVRRVAFFRVRGGRAAQLRAVSQRAGDPIYGPFGPDPEPRVITLAEGASIGFLGTNVGCTAVRDGVAPGIRCLAHSGQGLPGPCCGPNFSLLVGSHGFFLSTHRLQDLLVVGDGVNSPPYRVVTEWRS
jgi:hypothetical protein